MRLCTIISETSVICTGIRETEFAIFLKLFAFYFICLILIYLLKNMVSSKSDVEKLSVCFYCLYVDSRIVLVSLIVVPVSSIPGQSHRLLFLTHGAGLVSP